MILLLLRIKNKRKKMKKKSTEYEDDAYLIMERIDFSKTITSRICEWTGREENDERMSTMILRQRNTRKRSEGCQLWFCGYVILGLRIWRSIIRSRQIHSNFHPVPTQFGRKFWNENQISKIFWENFETSNDHIFSLLF